VHNQNVAGNFSGDLGHFVQNYGAGFTGAASEGRMRPTANILSRTLDWTRYYEPVLRPVAGFTKSSGDPIAIRGFRIMKQKDGTIDVTWKTDPALEKEWRGAGGFGKTAGFYMLKSLPLGVPEFIVPQEATKEALKNAKKLKSDNMRRCLEQQQLEACVEWVYEAATGGYIPIHKFLEDEAPAPEWGRLCEVGAIRGKRANMRVIHDYWDMSAPATRKTMWALPICPKDSHLAASTNHFHYSTDDAALRKRRLPTFRYKAESKKKAEVANHPNNVDGGWRAEENSDEDNESDATDESSERSSAASSTEEEKSPANRNPAKKKAPMRSSAASSSEEEKSPAIRNPAKKKAPMRERFEENFDKCVVGSIAVGLAQPLQGPSPYIFLGKIISVDRETREFEMKPYRCTTDSWKYEARLAKWHAHAKDKITTQPHYAVMAYSPALTKGHCLTAIAKRSVEQRTGVVWHKED
jgi:flagellar biosynthesis GTPase FlhF